MGLFDKIVGIFGGNDSDCDWYCDSCDAHLNRQPGFTTASGSWECTRCGAINDVTEDNILSEEEAEDLYQEECPKCGGHMARVGYSFDEHYPLNPLRPKSRSIQNHLIQKHHSPELSFLRNGKDCL